MSTLLSAFKIQPGATPIVWKNTGGTYGLTATSLAIASGREGAKGDLGSSNTKWAQRFAVLLTSSVASTPTEGVGIELWWGASDSATAGTNNPGNMSGTDATLTNAATLKFQLLQIGTLYLAAALTTGVQKQWFQFYPPMRYGGPLLYNASGLALGSTAADHSVTMIPIEETSESGIT